MNPHMPLLIRLIYANANFYQLLEEGLSYSQIAALIGEGIRSELILESLDGLEITKAGLAVLVDQGDRKKPRKDGGWIESVDQWRIDKIPKEAVYLTRDKYFLSS